jgi:hypothetical protein
MLRTSLGTLAICALIGSTALAQVAHETPARSEQEVSELKRIETALGNARSNKEAGERLAQEILDDIERTEKALIHVGTVVTAKRPENGSLATLPDVCATPMTPGPEPSPYPTIGGTRPPTRGTKHIMPRGRLSAQRYAKMASSDEASSVSLLEYLRVIRSEVAARSEFVAGICEDCQLKENDKQILESWLASTKEEILKQRTKFDKYFRRIEASRDSYLKQPKSD